MKPHIQYAILVLVGLLAVITTSPAAQAQGTLFVEGNMVGIGTPTPSHPLHVLKSDGTAKIFVHETNSTTQLRELFKLVNNGGPFFVFADSSIGQSYAMAMFGSDYIIDHQQNAGVELRVKPNGDLHIEGALFEGSSRSIKENIAAVDGGEVLERISRLPIATWSYVDDDTGAVHMGPMAEDFREAFGLGTSDKVIANVDTTGVTLAAIQGLLKVVEEQSGQIDELRARIAKLEAGRQVD